MGPAGARHRAVTAQVTAESRPGSRPVPWCRLTGKRPPDSDLQPCRHSRRPQPSSASEVQERVANQAEERGKRPRAFLRWIPRTARRSRGAEETPSTAARTLARAAKGKSVPNADLRWLGGTADGNKADFDALVQGGADSTEHRQRVPLVVCILEAADG